MKALLKNTLIVGCSFTGGMLAGILLSSPKNSPDTLKSLQGKATDAGHWLLSQAGSAVSEAQRVCELVNSSFKRSLADPIPDLYKYTEGFTLAENDLTEPGPDG